MYITKLLKKFVYDVEDFHKNDKQRPSPYIRNITTDAGSEFKGSARDYLNRQNIELQVVYPGTNYGRQVRLSEFTEP